MEVIYKVEGLGFWNVNAEKFVDQVEPTDRIIEINVPKGANKLEALKNLLEFEGYPTEKLTSDASRLEILIKQNKDFLLNMFILTSLDVEIPDEAMEKFINLKNQFAEFSDTAKLNLLGI